MALTSGHWVRGPCEHMDLEVKGQLYDVGACFEALFIGVLLSIAGLKFRQHFLCILTFGLKNVHGYYSDAYHFIKRNFSSRT